MTLLSVDLNLAAGIVFSNKTHFSKWWSSNPCSFKVISLLSTKKRANLHLLYKISPIWDLFSLL